MKLPAVGLVVCALCVSGEVVAADLPRILLAEGKTWPGKILSLEQGQPVQTQFSRGLTLPQELVPRIQSLTVGPNGRIIFCSGLDRTICELTGSGERQLHYGGGLARQVRTDAEGIVYWSGLETPLNGNPLPDGFIYAMNLATNETRVVMTFSQGDVGHDWWGAFDIRDGRILVGTLAFPSRIYDVSAAPVQLVATLPIGITAFRFMNDGSLWACDGHGKLYRYANLQNTEQQELLLDTSSEFVDFAPAP